MDISASSDWDSIFQFVADPLDMDFSEKAATETTTLQSARGLQVPTPPQSHDGTPDADNPSQDTTLVSVSTTFYPGAQINTLAPDAVLLASDGVFFYIHTSTLLAASSNHFNHLIPSELSQIKGRDAILSIPEHSTVLNVILHIIYDMSCAHYSPPFSVLVTAINHLPTYGITPKTIIVPSTPLYTLLLSHAPLFPLELYTLAASLDLYDLAVATSSHLLSFPLATLTDEMAELIGPIYLKRLFFLHFGRSDALKRVLLPPPHPHAPTPWCDYDDQKKLSRAWALASAYLAWDARPDLSTSTIEAALRPLAEHLTCEQCQQGLRDRIKNLVVQWSVVKRTI